MAFCFPDSFEKYTDGLPGASLMWDLNFEIVWDSVAFRATTNHVSLM